MQLTAPGLSFRDPSGYVERRAGRILRTVSHAASENIRNFLETAFARECVADGRIVQTLFTGESVRPGTEILEHERIPFASYPYEWPVEMLHRAAELTLDLSEGLLGQGYWLKDATPYNVLFRGPQPVFVDLPSFERRDPLDSTWLAYAQFTRTFMLILMAVRRLGRSPGELLFSRRDGAEPAELYRWANWRERLSPRFFNLVTLPVWLDGRRNTYDGTLYEPRRAASPEQADYIIGRLYSSLRRSLRREAPVPQDSAWTGYLDHKSLYSDQTLAAKEDFVRSALAEHAPKAVLDVGANEGKFSELAARSGARVVAIDSDAAVAGRLFKRAQAERLDVLPLVVDLARPTPGTGWRNTECESFLARAEGHFDMVMMLAVIHHMMVTERIPMIEVLRLAASLTKDLALIEFVGPEDPMFRRLVRGRHLLYRDLTVDQFQRECGCFFNTIRMQRLDGLDRWLFLLRKK